MTRNSENRLPAQSPRRREFLKTSAAAAAATCLPLAPKAFANQSKNDRPRIGCIGVGSMGTGDARGHA
ncbi:MAG: twin-arginine translocation signal domain-containing protein, partial [Planctomycetota bacterium]